MSQYNNLQTAIINIIENSSTDFQSDINDLVVFYIDNKSITFLNEKDQKKTLLVKGDSLSRKFCFVFQKYFENTDISQTYPTIIFTNGKTQYSSPKRLLNGEDSELFTNWMGLSSQSEVLEDENFIYFIWTIPPEFCLEAGDNNFSIILRDYANYRFVTKNLVIKIENTLDLENIVTPLTPTEVDRIAEVETDIQELRNILKTKQQQLVSGYGITIEESSEENGNPIIKLDTAEDSELYQNYLSKIANLQDLYKDYITLKNGYDNKSFLRIFEQLENLIGTVISIQASLTPPNYENWEEAKF